MQETNYNWTQNIKMSDACKYLHHTVIKLVDYKWFIGSFKHNI